tara:strand:+ start:327 stop:611 length:285 start_codon:yes stop_codon:yes gene_type:complete
MKLENLPVGLEKFDVIDVHFKRGNGSESFYFLDATYDEGGIYSGGEVEGEYLEVAKRLVKGEGVGVTRLRLDNIKRIYDHQAKLRKSLAEEEED